MLKQSKESLYDTLWEILSLHSTTVLTMAAVDD